MKALNSTRLISVFVAVLLASVNVAASESSAADPHAAHRHMMSKPTTKINRVLYSVPDVDLIDASGESTNLQSLLDEDKPVVVNFIFTTCTTICPVLTSTTLQLQKQLGDSGVVPNYVSISIDPDYDSASVLKKYAAKYGADWTFLTGTPENVTSALQAFDAYRGNKVNHFPLTLMRPANAEQWTRVEGLTSASELAEIWRDITS